MSRSQVGRRTSADDRKSTRWVLVGAVAVAWIVATAAPVSSQLVIHPLTSTHPKPFGHFGWSVAAAGDVDGDAVPDALVGAVNEDGVLTTDGAAYVFSGADGSLLFRLTSPGAQINGSFGVSVAGLGDVDGDGRGDLAVGAFRENGPGGAFAAGHVYVLAGSDGSEIYALTSPNAEFGGAFGESVAATGDVDGDGIGDLVVGALNEDGGAQDAGRAYLFSGADGGTIHTFGSPDPEAGGGFGNAVNRAGDVDGDGVDDVVVGAWAELGGGRAYVFDGANGSLLLTLTSPDPEAFFGNSVSSAGDTDGDGRAEVIVGAFVERDGVEAAGRAHVFRGDGTLLATLRSPAPEVRGRFGEFVAEVGDIDRDAIADWIVGAPNEDGGALDAGRVHLFSGADGELLFSFRSPTPNEFGLFGYSGAGPGDLGGDGAADLLIGTFFENGAGFDDGSAYLFVTDLGIPELVLSGACPGDVTLELTGQTPGAPVAVFAAENAGQTNVPAGPCAGTTIDLATPRLLGVFTTDDDGALSTTRTITNPPACAALVQVLDLSTCEVSNVARL